MATVVGGQVKKNDGTLITPQEGGWYDGRQYIKGTLSDPGVINPQSPQPGAGQLVSKEVNLQSDAAQGNKPGDIEIYLASQRKAALAGASAGGSGMTAGGSTAGGGTLGTGATGKAGVNLMEEQQKLYDASGMTDINQKIKDLEASVDMKKKEADKRVAEVNENPFLSDASRVGAIAKINAGLNDSLTSDQANLTNLQGQATAKTAEINQKLGIITQQFDMDKATRAENLALFNSLLGSGALQSATPQDLSNLSIQTGLPISFIQSAIGKANAADVQIEKTEDSNGNVTFVTLDKKTGKILSQEGAGKIGKGTTGTAGSITQQFANDAATVTSQTTPSGWVGQFPLLVAKYAPYMTLEEIYSNYLKSPLGQQYGTPKEDPVEIKEIYDQYRGY